MKVHKLVVRDRRSSQFRGSLCGRLNKACDDGMNVADLDAEVTCAFCLRIMQSRGKEAA